jgi:hypothetical protein
MNLLPMSEEDKIVHKGWMINYASDESIDVIWEVEKQLGDLKKAAQDTIFINKVIDAFYAGVDGSPAKLKLNYTRKLQFFYALLEVLHLLMGMTDEQVKNSLRQQQLSSDTQDGGEKEKVI